MTSKIYLYPDSPLTCEATITHVEPGEHPRVRLDRTVFHVKGGGQLADNGLLGTSTVLDARHAPEGDVDHMVDAVDGLRIGDTVLLKVDCTTRSLHSRLHTAGHTVAGVLAEPFPMAKPVQAHHYPGEARVEFEGDASLVDPISRALPELLAGAIRSDLPIRVLGDPERNRTIQIGSYPAIPCGGTHVRSLSELECVQIVAVKIKNGRLRVSYQLGAQKVELPC